MNQPMRMIRTVLTVVTALFWCAGVAFAEEGGQKIDPCALLAKAEIQAVVDQNVGDGALNTKANLTAGALCEYKVGDFGAFSMLVKTTGPGETADRTTTQHLQRPQLLDHYHNGAWRHRDRAKNCGRKTDAQGTGENLTSVAERTEAKCTGSTGAFSIQSGLVAGHSADSIANGFMWTVPIIFHSPRAKQHATARNND